jgi:hypothetical protein
MRERREKFGPALDPQPVAIHGNALGFPAFETRRAPSGSLTSRD